MLRRLVLGALLTLLPAAVFPSRCDCTGALLNDECDASVSLRQTAEDRPYAVISTDTNQCKRVEWVQDDIERVDVFAGKRRSSTLSFGSASSEVRVESCHVCKDAFLERDRAQALPTLPLTEFDGDWRLFCGRSDASKYMPFCIATGASEAPWTPVPNGREQLDISIIPKEETANIWLFARDEDGRRLDIGELETGKQYPVTVSYADSRVSTQCEMKARNSCDVSGVHYARIVDLLKRAREVEVEFLGRSATRSALGFTRAFGAAERYLSLFARAEGASPLVIARDDTSDTMAPALDRSVVEATLGSICETGRDSFGQRAPLYRDARLWKALYDLREYPKHQAEAIARAQSCIDGRIRHLKGSRDYPLDGSFGDFYDELGDFEYSGIPPIELSERPILIAQLYEQRGWTHLAHWDADFHDLAAAQDDFLAAEREIRSAARVANQRAAAFIADARRYYADQRALAQRRAAEERERAMKRRNDAMWGTMIGAIAGTALYSSAGVDDETVVRSALDVLESQNRALADQYDRSIGDIDQKLFRAEAELRFGQNALNAVRFAPVDGRPAKGASGARIYVDRYTTMANQSPQVSHPRAVVRVRNGGSYCSGAAVHHEGQTKILTAQHCVLDEAGRVAPSIGVEYEFVSFSGFLPLVDELRFTPAKAMPGSFHNNAVILRGPWTIQTPRASYTDAWANDWALISGPSLQSFHTMRLLLPDAQQARTIRKLLARETRVSLAGYAGDVMDGRFLTMDWACRSHGPDGGSAGVFEYDCAGFKGDSGAPVVFAETGWRGFVVGVNSYGQRSGSSASRNSRANGAVFIGRVLDDLSKPSALRTLRTR